MNNFLGKLLGTAPAPAPLPPRRTFDKAMERRARANGFNSAEEMLAWSVQRNRKSGGTIAGGSRPSLAAASAWHPKNILGYVLGHTSDALGY